MLAFLAANAATICVGAVLAAVVGLIIGSLYRDHKAGKHSCGGNCGSCSGCSGCHTQEK